MIILSDGVRYQLTTPKSEAVLENAIQANCEHIFGPDSFYFDIKKKIRTRAGVASIPDGYVIFFTPKPRWAIIEVELASHSIYKHVIPQLTKFNRGIEDSLSRKKLVEILYGVFDDDEILKARLKQKIKTGEVYKFISDLVSEKPLIVVAIDEKTEELDEALYDIRGDVKVVEFKTFRREGLSDDVNAYMFEPVETKPIIIPNAEIIDLPPKQRKKRQGIMHSVFELFDDMGVDNVTYDECESIARKVKPDTKFGKSHFSWYKNEYKRKRKGGLPRGTDKFGSRLGSNKAKINAVLSTEPKMMKTLVEEAGLSGVYYQHLNRLIEKGFVEKTDKGFREIGGSKTEIDVPTRDRFSEFWAPIRKEGLFKGNPVLIKDEGWIGKGIKGYYFSLVLHNHACEVKLWFRGENRLDRRKKIIALFPKTKYEYRLHESPKAAQVIFPVLEKGRKDRKDWPEIRKELTKLGADIYNKIKESDI